MPLQSICKKWARCSQVAWKVFAKASSIVKSVGIDDEPWLVDVLDDFYFTLSLYTFFDLVLDSCRTASSQSAVMLDVEIKLDGLIE